MTQLPTGTVTFMFTDIEGSTKLLRRLGERFASVRGEHHAIVRDALVANQGVEVGTEGDSFFAVFREAHAAVAAAVALQRALAEQRWPDGLEVRVRIGLHTGNGALSGPDYVGMDVHRAARIANAAHGGQVILSDATRTLVEHSLPAGTRLRDLGFHRLKDIEHAEHLYDLVVEGVRSDFPAPRTLDARPNNLPVQLTSFVGREVEIEEIRRRLDRTRLLTLTGPGGTGKTRLALEVAAGGLGEYAEGTFFVDLAPINDPVLVPAVIARAVRIQEVPGEPIQETVAGELRDKQVLLVVDNFEQVASAAVVIEDLLKAAPQVKVVVTSRFVLSLRGEQEYPVAPLQLPNLDLGATDAADVAQSPAVQLFVERAAAVNPQFQLTAENAPAVAELTARLDGLPLAIELAASRAKVLSPKEMIPRLRQSLSLLTSNAQTLPARQRTLRGAIAWSYDLLDPAEQRLFCRLSVFRGGWTVESAEAVAKPSELGLDALAGVSSLLDKSLIRSLSVDGSMRFSMLDTISEFGREQLVALDELGDARRRHGEHFLAFAVDAEPHLTGADQAEWLEVGERERDNVRAALRWAIEAGEWERAQQAAGSLWRFWQQRGHLAEGRRWLEEVLAASGAREPTAARAKALTGAGGIAWWQNDHAGARAFYDEALAIERHLGDPVALAEALYNDAFALYASGEGDRAVELLEECLALFRESNVEHGVARALAMLVLRETEKGAWESAAAKLDEVVSIWRRLGDRLQLAFDLIWLAFALGRVGRADDARARAIEALSLFCDASNLSGIALAFRDLSFLFLWEGRPDDALRFAGAAETVRERIGGGPPQGFGGMLEGDPAGEARAQLPAAEAQRSWEEGRGMDLDAAVQFARRRAAAQA